MLAAGDIGDCNASGDEATADLLDSMEGVVLALGDLAYEDGTASEFADCYDPSWGRHLGRTLAVPGNHEYNAPGAAPYFAYFGTSRAGDPGQGWYSLDVSAWHLIGLNSNCDEIGGCGPGSAQLTWLQADLAADASAHPNGCTVAFWHHPRWSSGHEHGSDGRTDALWRALFGAGADVVLTAHDHEYERFVPMSADGTADPTGMVQFVVGTGGRSLYDFAAVLPTSAARDNATFGVLRLTLREGGYDWAFVPTSPGGFTDAGSADCR